MKDSEILADFTKFVGDFFPATVRQRDEIYRSYEYRDCRQIDATMLQERNAKDKAVTVINLAAPLIRAVSGAECMQDKAIDYVPMDEEFDAEIDIMADCVEYAQYASGYDSEQSMAREDAATCGLGATVTNLDFSKKDFIAGIPNVERIFPGFLFYDNSSRGARINTRAQWCGYGDPMDIDALTDYIKDKLGAKKADETSGSSPFVAELLTFSNQDNLASIDMLYHWFWWEYADIFDVANPFLDQQSTFGQIIVEDDDAVNLIGATANKIKIDWQASYWSLDTESFTELKNTIETIALLLGVEVPELEFSKRKGKCYYRAEIARGAVLSKSRSFTQGGHALNFITGYYDETGGIYYGMMRPISFVQDALNLSMSDFLSYAKTAGHGGAAYIQGAGDAFERIKKEKANEDALTPLPPGAIVTPKALMNTPQVQVEMIRLLMELMPRTLGLGQEFLGIITSGDMTDSLYGKVMKQSYAVLANFNNASAGYSKRQAEIFMDIIRLMAEANDGMILPILSPNKKEERYIRLRKQNLAMNYSARIVERPMTVDERQNTFNTLSQLAPQFQQAGVNIMPVLAKYANLDMEDRQQLIELSTPQPPPPNPLNDNLLKSQADLQSAQAAKLMADAQETTATLTKTVEKLQTEIEKNSAQTMQILAEADTETAPLLKLEELAMRERIEMAKIDSNARIKREQTEASAKPAVQMQFNADDALGAVVDKMGAAAQNVERMTAASMQSQEKTADALLQAAGAITQAARVMSAPKEIDFKFNKQGRPVGATQTPAL